MMTSDQALKIMNKVSLHQTNRLFPGTFMHPLTCGRDSRHTPLFPFWDGMRVCLICADCGYTQHNAGPCDESIS